MPADPSIQAGGFRHPRTRGRGAAAALLLAGALAPSCAVRRSPPSERGIVPGPSAERGPVGGGEVQPEGGTHPPEAPAADPGSGQEPDGQEPAPEAREQAPAPPVAPPRLVTGSLGLRYRGRATDDDQDHEIRGVLTLDFRDPRAPWIQGHLMARADLDLDGLDEGPIFQDLTDTYDGSLVGRLYLAYADVELGPSVAASHGTLRVGRQSDPRLPEVLRLDGASFLSRPLGSKQVQVGLYAGVPVHIYDRSREGDRAFGTFVEGLPWEGGRARLDWMHLEDELVLGEEQNDLLSLGLWQELSRRWRLEGELTRLENDPRDMRLLALYQDPASETVARIGYYELQETQTQRVTELDPFFESLLEYYPFRQVNLNMSRALGAHTILDAGFDVRRVSDSDDVGEFNRDWERYYVTATLHDAPVEGLSFSLTADRWDDDDRDTSSVGADVTFEQEGWRTSLGTYYALYKYQLLELEEQEDVRTYYARAVRELSRSLQLDLGYEFEDDDFETYHTLRWGLQWRF